MSEEKLGSVERLAAVKNQTISIATSVDGIAFVECHFTSEASLLYNGGIPPTFCECTFEPNVSWVLHGAALWSAVFIRHFQRTFDPDLVAGVDSARPTFLDCRIFAPTQPEDPPTRTIGVTIPE
jgi:hypothetical protein